VVLREYKALFSHSEWADALVWRSILDSGHGDTELRRKLHHLHMVQWAYLHIWRGEQIQPREASTFPTLGAMSAWAREYYRELSSYLSGVAESDLDRQLEVPWAERLVERFGTARAATWSETVLQVVLHSSHHRGQLLRRLRELGSEAPLTDFIAWIWMGRPEADWGEDDAA
jgi:uncharacterized damage-inducible protein DinB